MVFRYLFSWSVLLFVLASCSEKASEQKRDLPNSTGNPGQVLVLMDSIHWAGVLGETMKAFLEDDYPVTLRSEKHYELSSVKYAHLGAILKKRYLIIVPVIDEENLNTKFKPSIPENVFLSEKKNWFSSQQTVIFLSAKNEQDFVIQLKKKATELKSQLDNAVVQRAKERVFSSSRQIYQPKGQNFLIEIPNGWNQEIVNDEFFWFRKADHGISLNLFGAVMPYLIDEQLQEQEIQAWRNDLGRKYLLGNDDPETYMIIENQVPVVLEDSKFSGVYAKKMSGLWRLNKIVMGGSFVSYSFVSPDRKDIYYLEGFVYAPGEQKSNYLRSLEAVLSTFRFEKTQSGN